jgi:hypothetical protein
MQTYCVLFEEKVIIYLYITEIKLSFKLLNLFSHNFSSVIQVFLE